jgi:uncharacterized membrane protein YjjB (DUF3815 family)
MQAISAYLIVMLTLVEVGLGITVAAVLAIGIYQCVACTWSRTERESRSLAAVPMRLTS